MSETPLNYQTTYEWTGNSEAGEVRIGDIPVLPVGSPHNRDRYCPEHILVVAAKSCLANYVLLISRMSKLNVLSYRSSAEGELIKDSGGYQFTRIRIHPVLKVEPGQESMAKQIVAKAHNLCIRCISCSVC